MLMAFELKEKFDIDIYWDTVDVYCHCFENNSGTLELAKFPKMRPNTKNTNICYHHFREYVRWGQIKIHAIDTNDLIEDMLTKPLQQKFLVKHITKCWLVCSSAMRQSHNKKAETLLLALADHFFILLLSVCNNRHFCWKFLSQNQ